MSGRGKVSGGGKARAKAKTRSSRAGLQFPVVCINLDLYINLPILNILAVFKRIMRIELIIWI